MTEADQVNASKNGDDDGRIVVRAYKASDQDDVERLYHDGLIEGKNLPNDTGADIDNMEEAYFGDNRAHFWIAEYEGEIAGMIGVLPYEPNVAQIRRLRIDKRFWGKGVRTELLKEALAFCRHHEYLKVVLDTWFERGSAIGLFEQFAFQHHRDRSVPGKEMLEFYIDLYREPKKG